MDATTAEQMPGDAEAAGAVAGTIETTCGAAVGSNQVTVWVDPTWRDYGQSLGEGFVVQFQTVQVVADLTATEGTLVVRYPWGGCSATDPRSLHPTKERAMVAAIETLIDRREKLTTQIAELKSKLASIVVEGNQ